MLNTYKDEYMLLYISWSMVYIANLYCFWLISDKPRKGFAKFILMFCFLYACFTLDTKFLWNFIICLYGFTGLMKIPNREQLESLTRSHTKLNNAVEALDLLTLMVKLFSIVTVVILPDFFAVCILHKKLC